MRCRPAIQGSVQVLAQRHFDMDQPITEQPAKPPEPQVMRYKKVIKLLLCVDRDRNRKHKLCETLSRSGLETRSAASRTFVCVRRVLAPCPTVLWAFCLQRFLDGGTSVSTTAVRSRTLT